MNNGTKDQNPHFSNPGCCEPVASSVVLAGGSLPEDVSVDGQGWVPPLAGVPTCLSALWDAQSSCESVTFSSGGNEPEQTSLRTVQPLTLQDRSQADFAHKEATNRAIPFRGQ